MPSGSGKYNCLRLIIPVIMLVENADTVLVFEAAGKAQEMLHHVGSSINS